MSLSNVLTINAAQPSAVPWADVTFFKVNANNMESDTMNIQGEADFNVINADTLSTNHFGLATGDLIDGYVLTTDNGGLGTWRASASKGDTGSQGPQGIKGDTGSQGVKGDTGSQGVKGDTGSRGDTGAQGDTGSQGAQGDTGATGPIIAAGDFYALMPGDNASTVAVGSDVEFPQDGVIVGTSITRFNTTQIRVDPGIYNVAWQVSVDEPGQLQVALGGVAVANTVVGRATGTSQICGNCIVQANGVEYISIRNPAGNAAALTITPIAGGTHAVSAHLVITRLQ